MMNMSKFPTEIKIPRLNDMHAHLRDGAVRQIVLPFSSQHFCHVLWMPNVGEKGITTGKEARAYQEALKEAVVKHPPFTPLMSIKLTQETTSEEIKSAARLGVTSGKAYPTDVTTNSQAGIRDFSKMDSIFSVMEKVDIVLCIHGELPGRFSLDREDAFLVQLGAIAHKFPRLRIVLEHVSSARAVQYVKDMPDTVAATITLHHLVLTLDDVVGGNLNPHHFCKPILKRPSDQHALHLVAFEGHRKFFFGSDSAPHPPQDKTWPTIKPGVFSAPVIVPLLVQLFTEQRLQQLQEFTVNNSARFYRLPTEANHKYPLKLVRETWEVPSDYEGIVPLYAGKKLNWKIADETVPTA